MNEKQTVLPSKKQKELLSFIEAFIAEHGYSPSYREVMSGLNYTSVATVALHVNNLITRGFLIKRDRSARSLSVTKQVEAPKLITNEVKPGEEKWLIEKVNHFFLEAESIPKAAESQIDQLYVLVGTLRVLGLEGAAQSFLPRLKQLKDK